MARRLPLAYFNDFSRGLNTIVSASKVADSESPDLENIEFTESGLPSKRRGILEYGNQPNSRVLGLGRLYTASGTRRHLQVSGTGLYYYNGGTWTLISGKTFTADKKATFVQVSNAVYIHNGTDSMGKYDGTTLSTPTYGATGKFGIYFANRHVVSGNTSNPSRVYFSSSLNADMFSGLTGTATAGAASTLTDSGKTWTVNEFAGLSITITAGTGAGQVRTIASNTATVITVSTAWTTNPDTTSQYAIEGGDTIDIAKNDGQKVTGLAKFESTLIIFKERSVYSLTFDDNGLPDVNLISSGYGCVAHNTIDNVENDIFFLAHDGVRALGYVPNIPGVIRTSLMSAKVQTEIDNINPLYYENCCAINNDNKYILSFPQGSQTTCNRMIVWHTLYGAWSLWTGLTAGNFNEFVGDDNREVLYFGSDSSGYVYEMLYSTYSDNGTAISSSYYTKQFDLGAFDIKKRILFVDIQLRALTGTLSIDVIVDGETLAKSVQLTSTFSGADGLRVFLLREPLLREDAGSTAELVATDDVRRIKIGRNARTVQVRVYNENADENFTLMALSIGYVPRSPFNFESSKVIY